MESIRDIPQKSLNHLKDVLEIERNDNMMKSQYIVELENNISSMSIDAKKSELLSLLLSKDGCMNTRLIPYAMKHDILPTSTFQSTNLWCCVRNNHDNWSVFRSDETNTKLAGSTNGDMLDSLIASVTSTSNSMNESVYDYEYSMGQLQQCYYLDELMLSSTAGSIVNLQELFTSTQILDLIQQGYSNNTAAMKSLVMQDKLYALTISPRCIWIIFTDITEQALIENCTKFYSLFDLASTMQVSALNQYLQHQSLLMSNLANDAMKVMSNHLHTNSNNSSSSKAIWSGLPQLLSRFIPSSSCELYIVTSDTSTSNNNSNNNSVVNDLIVINSSYNIYSTQYTDEAELKCFIGAVVSQQSTVVCENVSSSPIVNKVIDCGHADSSNYHYHHQNQIQSLLGLPLFVVGNGSSEIQCYTGIIFRFSDRVITQNDIRFSEMLVSSVTPLVKSWLDVHFSRIVSPFNHYDGSSGVNLNRKNNAYNDINDSVLGGRHHSDGDDDCDGDEDEDDLLKLHIDPKIKSYHSACDNGLSGLASDIYTMQSLTRSLNCDWVICFLPPSDAMLDAMLADVSLSASPSKYTGGSPGKAAPASPGYGSSMGHTSLDFYSFIDKGTINDDDKSNTSATQVQLPSSTITISELSSKLRRFILKLFKKSSSNKCQEIETVNGADMSIWGLMGLLRVDHKSEKVALSLPCHLCNMISFTLLDTAIGSVTSSAIIIGGNYGYHITIDSNIINAIQSLQSVVDASVECRDLRTLFHQEEALENTVNEIEMSRKEEVALKEYSSKLHHLFSLYAHPTSDCQALQEMLLSLKQLMVETDANISDITLHYLQHDKDMCVCSWMYHVDSNDWLIDARTAAPTTTPATSVLCHTLYTESGYDGSYSNSDSSTSSRVFTMVYTIELRISLRNYSDMNGNATTTATHKIYNDKSVTNYLSMYIKLNFDTIFNVCSVVPTDTLTIALQSIEHSIYRKEDLDTYTSSMSTVSQLKDRFMIIPVSRDVDVGNAYVTGYPAIPLQVAELINQAIEHHTMLWKTDSEDRFSSSLVSLPAAVLYYYLVDAGKSSSVTATSTSLLYTYAYRTRTSIKYVQYVVISTKEMLFWPTYIGVLHQEMDVYCSPLLLGCHVEQCRTFVDSLNSICASNRSRSSTNSSGTSAACATSKRKYLSDVDINDGFLTTDGRGFIEEADDRVHQLMSVHDDGYVNRTMNVIACYILKYSEACMSTFTSKSCIGCAAYCLGKHDLLALIHASCSCGDNDSSRQSSIDREDAFNSIRSRDLLLCYATDTLNLSKTSRVSCSLSGWDKQRHYPHDASATTHSSYDINIATLGVYETNKYYRAGTPSIGASPDHVRVVMVTVVVNSFVFAAGTDDSTDDSKDKICIARLFFYIDDSISNASVICNTVGSDGYHHLHRHIYNDLYSLGNIVSYTITDAVSNIASAYQLQSRVKGLLIDEVSQCMVHKSVIAASEMVIAKNKSSKTLVDCIRKVGYISTNCTRLLDDIDAVVKRCDTVSDDLKITKKAMNVAVQFIKGVYVLFFPPGADCENVVKIDETSMKKIIERCVFYIHLLNKSLHVMCSHRMYGQITEQLVNMVNTYMQCDSTISHPAGKRDINWVNYAIATSESVAGKGSSSGVSVASAIAVGACDNVSITWCFDEMHQYHVTNSGSRSSGSNTLIVTGNNTDIVNRVKLTGTAVEADDCMHYPVLARSVNGSVSVAAVVRVRKNYFLTHPHCEEFLMHTLTDISSMANLNAVDEALTLFKQSAALVPSMRYSLMDTLTGSATPTNGYTLSASTWSDLTYFLFTSMATSCSIILPAAVSTSYEGHVYLIDADSGGGSSGNSISNIRKEDGMTVSVSEGVMHSIAGNSHVHYTAVVTPTTVDHISFFKQFKSSASASASVIAATCSTTISCQQHQYYYVGQPYTVSVQFPYKVAVKDGGRSDDGSCVVATMVGTIVVETNERPTAQTLSFLESFAMYISSAYDNSIYASDLAHYKQKVTALEEKLTHTANELNKEVDRHYISENTSCLHNAFIASIHKCHSVDQLEKVVCTMGNIIGATHVSILRVDEQAVSPIVDTTRDTTRDNLEVIQITYGTNERPLSIATSAVSAPASTVMESNDVLATRCLLSNTIITSTSSTAIGVMHAYVPVVACVSALQSDTPSSEKSWVLLIQFTDEHSFTQFTDSNSSINHFVTHVSYLLRQWLKAYKCSITADMQRTCMHTLHIMSSELSCAFNDVRTCQANGMIASFGALAAALAHSLVAAGSSVADCRLYWNESNATTAKQWKTCRFIQDTDSQSYTLASLLTTKSWKESTMTDMSVLSIIPAVIDESIYIYNSMATTGGNNDKIYLSVGVHNHPAILELVVNGKYVDRVSAEEGRSLMSLVKELLSQVVGGLMDGQKNAIVLTSSAVSTQLTLQQVGILNACISQLCHEASNSQQDIDNLCASLQSNLIKLPGVYSVLLSISNTKSNESIYEQLCISPLVNDRRQRHQVSHPPFSPVAKHGTTSELTPGKSPVRSPGTPVVETRNTSATKSEGLELLLDCGNVSGILTVSYMTYEECKLAALSFNANGNITAGSSNSSSDYDDTNVRYGCDYDLFYYQCMSSSEYRQHERHLFQTIAKSLARRVYELIKGMRNVKLMTEKRNEMLMYKNRMLELDGKIAVCESSKAEIILKHEQLIIQSELMKEQLKSEQVTLDSFRQKCKDRGDRISELKDDIVRKEQVLQQSLAAIAQERKLGEEKRHALLYKYDRAIDGEKNAEEERRKVSTELSYIESSYNKRIAAAEAVILSLKSDIALAHEMNGHADGKLKVLHNKLALAHDELNSCKGTISVLKKELDSCVVALQSKHPLLLDDSTDATAITLALARAVKAEEQYNKLRNNIKKEWH